MRLPENHLAAADEAGRSGGDTPPVVQELVMWERMGLARLDLDHGPTHWFEIA